MAGSFWETASPGTRFIRDRYMNILTGRMKPWELPEFQGIENRLRKTGALQRQGMTRQLSAAGVRGPALALAQSKALEGEMKPMGAAITGAYNRAPGMVMGAQSHLDQLQEAAKNRILGYQQARKSRKSQERIARAGQMSSAASCVLGTACCGAESSEVSAMRFFRDFFMPKQIQRGYYVFSDAIFPAMRFKGVRRFVKATIVNPLLRAGCRFIGMEKGSSDWLVPFDTAVSWILLKFWSILGDRGPYRRKSGEIV